MGLQGFTAAATAAAAAPFVEICPGDVTPGRTGVDDEAAGLVTVDTGCGCDAADACCGGECNCPGMLGGAMETLLNGESIRDICGSEGWPGACDTGNEASVGGGTAVAAVALCGGIGVGVGDVTPDNTVVGDAPATEGLGPCGGCIGGGGCGGECNCPCMLGATMGSLS